MLAVVSSSPLRQPLTPKQMNPMQSPNTGVGRKLCSDTQDEQGPFECYLLVTQPSTGAIWTQEITKNMLLDLTLRIKHFLKTQFCGELRLDGGISRGIDGHYYASIITDSRPIDTHICWDGGGF